MSLPEIQARIATIQSQFLAPSQRSGTQPAAVTATTGAPKAARAGASAQAPSFADVIADLQAGTSGKTAATGDWASKLPSAGQAWAGHIDAAAKAAGIDPRVVAAVAWTESGFRADAASGAGARGLMQLMPATAAGLGVNPDDPRQNLAGGARYLAEQIKKFGRLDLALAAYNAGPGAVQRHGGVPPYPETKAYVGRVMDRLRSL